MLRTNAAAPHSKVEQSRLQTTTASNAAMDMCYLADSVKVEHKVKRVRHKGKHT
jgi:hypothetical protein